MMTIAVSGFERGTDSLASFTSYLSAERNAGPQFRIRVRISAASGVVQTVVMINKLLPTVRVHHSATGVGQLNLELCTGSTNMNSLILPSIYLQSLYSRNGLRKCFLPDRPTGLSECKVSNVYIPIGYSVLVESYIPV